MKMIGACLDESLLAKDGRKVIKFPIMCESAPLYADLCKLAEFNNGKMFDLVRDLLTRNTYLVIKNGA